MIFSKSDFGFSYQTNHFHIFFGNRFFIQEKFQYRFLKIKQTHSDLVVANSSSSELVEADAHYSGEKMSALLIATADCLPIMIYCQQTKRVAAVHAGWKGVANQILYKTLKKLIATGSDKSLFNIFIGPHILQQSFEVDEDVFFNLQKSQFGLIESDYSFFQNNKYYVNLDKIITSQILEACKATPEIQTISIDTKTNSDFHSFRRDKALAGRNLSFIALL